MAKPRYKSEVFVPIRQDDQSFEERQKDIWGDMHDRMERRRREWENEVERMRSDFFSLKPTEKRRGSSENLLEKRDLNDIFYDDRTSGNKKFHVSFDVSQFDASEISVKTENQKLLVHAKHEETGSGRNVSREFSRQVDVPHHVDPNKLTCTLSSDGILQVEAPVTAPEYDRIRENATDHGASAAMPSRSTVPFYPGAMTKEQDGSRMFKISVDIGKEFGPEDLNIKTVDKRLIVKARHEETSHGRSSCQEFSREFDLPENVDPNYVTASLSDEGKLLIEAPISSYTQGSYAGKPNSKKQPIVTVAYDRK
jgi:HSP20 family molecular chaperone IbpA